MKIKDEQIMAALARFGTKTAAAKALGITPETIRNRMKKESFRKKYNAMLDDIMSECVDCMKLALKDSVKTLLIAMADDNTPPQTKVAAADAMMRHVQRFVELQDNQEVKRRIEALERERHD